jgi:hypothetical protein
LFLVGTKKQKSLGGCLFSTTSIVLLGCARVENRHSSDSVSDLDV